MGLAGVQADAQHADNEAREVILGLTRCLKVRKHTRGVSLWAPVRP